MHESAGPWGLPNPFPVCRCETFTRAQIINLLHFQTSWLEAKTFYRQDPRHRVLQGLAWLLSLNNIIDAWHSLTRHRISLALLMSWPLFMLQRTWLCTVAIPLSQRSFPACGSLKSYLTNLNACALSKAGKWVDEMRTKVTSGIVELFLQKSYNWAKHRGHSYHWSVHIYK